MSDMKKSFSLSESIRYFFYRIISKSIGMLSPSALTLLSQVLGKLLWFFLITRKKKTIAAVKKHLQCSNERSVAIAKSSFVGSMRSFLEVFHVRQYDEKIRTAQMLPNSIYQEFKNETAPVVIATAHIGSWELFAAMVEQFHPDRSRMVVVRTQKDRAMTQLLTDLRSAKGIEPIGHRHSAQKVMACLKNKGTVAFLVDHNCSRKEAIFLPFLGSLAAVNSGPAMLALRAKAVIYPLFNIRESDNKSTCYLYPPLRTADLEGTINERVKIIATYYTDCVADIVCKYPEQWFWMHDRWKTQP